MDYEQIANNTRASQNKVELAHLLKTVSLISPKIIVEIGSWRGWLLDTFEQAFPEARVIGIEKDKDNIDPAYGVTEKIIIGESGFVLTHIILKRMLKGKMVDFLFIVGDHTLEAVKADFYQYKDYVRPGGIIAFHDASLTGHPQVEVYKLWEELEKVYPQSELIIGQNKDAAGIQQTGTGTGIIHI